MDGNNNRTTYQSYLRLKDLLSLQEPLTDSRHEGSFLTVHQIVELLFKNALMQNTLTIKAMQSGSIAGLSERISSATNTIRLAATNSSHLESLAPWEFAEFRGRLGSASGAQSHQFRELEIQGGLNENEVPSFGRVVGSWEDEAVRARLTLPSLRFAFVSLIARWGLISESCQGVPKLNEGLLTALRRIYVEQRFMALLEISEALFGYDEIFNGELRWRHLQVARRVIGGVSGTIGTSGVIYLEKRLPLRFLPEIAIVRTEVREQSS